MKVKIEAHPTLRMAWKQRAVSLNFKEKEKCMRKFALALMTVALFGAMPVFAEQSEMKMEHEGVRECALQAETIQEKIKRFETEIAKGEKKYSAKDLKNLNKKLKEANELLDEMNNN
jgi:hypothetical protein